MKTFLYIVLLFACHSVLSQNLLDSLSLATCPAYTDLKVALEHPDDVVKLVLERKNSKNFR